MAGVSGWVWVLNTNRPTKGRMSSASKFSLLAQRNGAEVTMFFTGPVKRWVGVDFVRTRGCWRPPWPLMKGARKVIPMMAD